MRSLVKKKLFREYKIREVQVKLTRLSIVDNPMYRDALFEKNNIRNCSVRIDRMPDGQIPKGKRYLSAPKAGTVRSQVLWLPSISTTKPSSIAVLKDLAEYQKDGKLNSPNRNGTKENATKRQRSLSMHVIPSGRLLSNNVPMDDFHTELLSKCNSPNRGLKPVDKTPNLNKEIGPNHGSVPAWQTIFDEFQAKKTAMQNK